MSKYTESTLEEATLEWLGELGYEIIGGPEIAPAPDGERPERNSYSDVILAGRLKKAINRINPDIPEPAREEAWKKVLRISNFSPQLNLNNKAFHTMLQDGIDVEYQRP